MPQKAKKPPRSSRLTKPAATPACSRGFFVVGIGASAGGLEALEELFAPIPADTGLAFVVITHQHPGHTSLLPELLGKNTELKVIQAADGLKVEPNCVYISPPGGQLAILNGVLHRTETADTTEAPRLPIDYFFRSLAGDLKEKAICIILSGTGTDGTLGVKAIKGESGMVIVQQAHSAKYAGMPSSALATGLADYVLPAGEMGKQLAAYARSPYLVAAHEEQPASELPEPMQKIFALLRRRTGNDFSCYKSTTIRRRIERRMNLHQIEGPAQYIRYLQENPHEIDILFRELLISVTSFFRDPEAFDTLAKSALPELLRSRPDGYAFRMWVAGCASGEEVFSLAILMREAIETEGRHLGAQIFGTDLDNEAIDFARNSQYPAGIAADVPAPRLERYFVRGNGGYRVRKDIRDMAIFAVQNVIKDPPFTKLDLISCRNVLIYLNAELQKRLLPIFHYALQPGGLLFLGPAETIGGFTDLFEVADSKWKIFRRKETAHALHPLMGFTAQPDKADTNAQVPATMQPPRDSNIAGIVDRLLLARFAPASVVVNNRGDVIYIHGRTGAYLEPSSGQPRLNVLDMAREGLQIDLGSALRQAAAHDREVSREDVRVKTNGDFIRVRLSVVKIQEPESVRGLFLITFRPQPPAIETGETKGSSRDTRANSRARQLEHELQRTKESLQITIEELETSNEELKRPTRNCNLPTRNCRARTRRWKPPRRKCSRSTKN